MSDAANDVFVTEIGSYDDHTFFLPAVATDPQQCGNQSSSACDNIWWRERITGAWRGEITSTWGPSARLQLTFQGTGISVAGITDADGARALGSIDGGEPTAADFSSPDGKRHFNVTVFEAANLDGTRRHVLNLWFDPSNYGNAGARRYIRVNTFDAEATDDSVDAIPRVETPAPFTTPTSSGSSPIATPSGTTVPRSSHSLTQTDTLTGSRTDPTGTAQTELPEDTRASDQHAHSTTITAIAVSVPLVVSLIVAAIFFLWWRRRKRRSTPSPLPVRVREGDTSSVSHGSSVGGHETRRMRIGQHPDAALRAKHRGLLPSESSSVEKAASHTTGRDSRSYSHSSSSHSAPATHVDSLGQAEDVHATPTPQFAALQATMQHVGISATSLRAFLERLPQSGAHAPEASPDVPPPTYAQGP